MSLAAPALRPGPGLIGAAVLLQVLCIAVPSLWSPGLALLVSGGLLLGGYALFSVPRALLATLVLNVVLPTKVLFALVLPGGLRFQEGLLLVVFFFALIDLLYCRGLRLRTSGADGPVLVFLGATLASVLVGIGHANSASQILRDMRFPFYYAAFFLFSNFVDEQTALRRFLPALVLAGLAVSVEYVLEFMGAIDLSMGTRFVRVVRLEGLILPVAILLVAGQFIHAPGRWGRPLLGGLLLPLGLAFVLTVGRGMWVAVGVGLLVLVGLHYFGQPQPRRGAGRVALLVLGVLVAVVAAAVLFQRFTGAAIGAHALERSLTFVDLEREAQVLVRLMSYGATIGAIAQHPLLGNGQGATLNVLSLDPETHLPEMITAWTVDSLYLSLWWKMGLPGLLAFLWLGWRMGRLAYGAFRSALDREQRAFAGGAMAVLAGMAVLGLSDPSMVTSRFALVFALFFGMIAVVARGAERAPTG